MKITVTFSNDAFSVEVRKPQGDKQRVITVKPVHTVFTYERALTLADDFEKLLDLAMETKLDV